jgi:hypothetical protein
MPLTADTSSKIKRLTTLLGVLMSTTSMVACGGGDELASAVVLDSASLAKTAILHEYCEVTTPIQVPQPGESGLDYAAWKTWNNGSLTETSGTVYAWGRAETNTFGVLTLQTNYRNYSGAVGSTLSPSGDAAMGVAISDVLPDQAVGCVRSVAHPVFVTNWTGGSWLRTVADVHWYGRETGALPVADLPGVPRNGFEFAANFEVPAEQGFVNFNVSRSEMPDPSVARVCQQASGASSWVCSVPTAHDTGSSWSLRLPGVKPGVYVLI